MNCRHGSSPLSVGLIDEETETGAARLERCRCPVKRFLRRAERRLPEKNIARYISKTSGEEYSKLRAKSDLNYER
jgi:hypothetical protein